MLHFPATSHLETWTSPMCFILLHHSLCQASPFSHFPPSLVLKWKLPQYERDKLVLGRRSKKKGKDCFNKQATNVQNSQVIHFLISSTILQSYLIVNILPILQTKKLRLGNNYGLMLSSHLQRHSFHSSKLPLFICIHFAELWCVCLEHPAGPAQGNRPRAFAAFQRAQAWLSPCSESLGWHRTCSTLRP